MTNDRIHGIISRSGRWNAYEALSPGDAAQMVARHSGCRYDSVRTAQVLDLMVKSGEADRIFGGKFVKRANAKPWLCHKWNRTMTNAQLGIEPSRFGVPV